MIHIYFQIFCLFFTTIYKLLEREDQGLSPRKCFINILKLYYTAVQNCALVHVYASTLAFTCLSNFGYAKTRISIFLLVECILFIVKTFKGKIFISNWQFWPDSLETFQCSCRRNFLCLQMISFEFLIVALIGWTVSRGKHFVHMPRPGEQSELLACLHTVVV